jgi:Fe-S oxidoreductase
MHARARKHGLTLKQKLIAHLPRYAPVAAKLAPLMNLRDRVPGLAALSESMLGFSAKRSLPHWRSDAFRNDEAKAGTSAKEVVLLVDTFTRYFEPENARAALRVLEAAGYRVHLPTPIDGGRPLCCGRTFLAEGLVAEARAEMQRTIEALSPFIEHRTAIVGLEPSCLLTFRDELLAVLPGRDADGLSAQAMLFEEFLVAEHKAGRLNLPLKAIDKKHALVHGHCHQKAFAVMGAVQATLKLVPGLDVKVVESSCCGMAGAFGYETAHYDVSMKMAEMSLLPAMRAASGDTVLVADGTSCRHQIRDGANREAVHVARVLERALA